MKTTEFIVENEMIAQEAHDMHKDHEVQMARSQMYSAAEAAIEIHKMLRDISEMEGLEGWVQSKLTLASEYLESVRDYLKYEAASQQTEMMPFAEGAADYAVDRLLAEDDYDDAVSNFLSKNKPVQGKTHKPRKSERLGGSRHIGGSGEKMKSSRTGIGSKPTGKAVAGQASLGEDEPKQRQWNDDDFYAYDPETNTIKDQWGYKSTGRFHHERAAQEKGWKVVRGMSAKFMDLKEGKRPVSEMTGGSTGSSGMAIVVSGGGNHKPGTGKPKKIGNAASMKKVQVGKGIY